MIICAGVALALIQGNTTLVPLLLFSATLPLIAVCLTWRTIPRVNPDHDLEGPKLVLSLPRGLPNITICLALCAVFSGLTGSFIAPYLPVILKKAGFTPATVMMFSGGASLMMVVLHPYILKLGHHWGMSLAYMAGMTALSLLTVPLYFSGWIWGFGSLILLRRIAGNMAGLAASDIKMKIIDRARAAESMGLLQSAFLLGDMLGGSVAGFIWSQPNANIVFPLVGLALAARGIFLSGRCAGSAPMFGCRV